MSYEKRRVEVWGSEGHPAKGLAQAQRKPVDRMDFMRSALRGEFSKVIKDNGVPAAMADQLHLVIQNFLADQLRKYLQQRYLIQVDIAGGMTLEKAIEVTVRVLRPELERRRLARKAGDAAAERRWGT